MTTEQELLSLAEMKQAASDPRGEYINYMAQAAGFDFHAAAAEMKRMREALEWYADIENHTDHSNENEYAAAPVWADMGNRARQALNNKQGE